MGRIEGFHVIHCTYASHASNRSQVNKCNESHYPASDETEIVVDDTIPARAKLAYLLCYNGWLRPKINTKGKVTECKQTALHRLGGGLNRMIKRCNSGIHVEQV